MSASAGAPWLDDPPVSISRHLQQAADLLRRTLVTEELLLALSDGCVLEFESARAATMNVRVLTFCHQVFDGGKHGDVLKISDP
jgi:hypothetical protein